jgi:hypothetical protein
VQVSQKYESQLCSNKENLLYAKYVCINTFLAAKPGILSSMNTSST